MYTSFDIERYIDYFVRYAVRECYPYVNENCIARYVHSKFIPREIRTRLSHELNRRFKELKTRIKEFVKKRLGLKFTVEDLVTRYIEYLKKRDWVDDWFRWGGHSVNLYDLWREYFHDIPWSEFLKTVKRFAKEITGIEYTHYFIYSEENAHSINIGVDTAKDILGSKIFEDLLSK